MIASLANLQIRLAVLLAADGGEENLFQGVDPFEDAGAVTLEQAGDDHLEKRIQHVGMELGPEAGLLQIGIHSRKGTGHRDTRVDRFGKSAQL
jgi:hypothetical protein